jgi:hypothetical protein
MQRPSCWLTSDPLANPQFRRGWTHPPPKRRSPASLAGDARADFVKHSDDTDTITETAATIRARLAAEALFVRGPLAGSTGEVDHA